MIGLGLLLAALGIGDLAATGISGVPANLRQVGAGTVTAGIVALAGGLVADLSTLSVARVTLGASRPATASCAPC